MWLLPHIHLVICVVVYHLLCHVFSHCACKCMSSVQVSLSVQECWKATQALHMYSLLSTDRNLNLEKHLGKDL